MIINVHPSVDGTHLVSKVIDQQTFCIDSTVSIANNNPNNNLNTIEALFNQNELFRYAFLSPFLIFIYIIYNI